MNKDEILQVAKPILFNTEMVLAILDGRKTQTRRFANINRLAECHGVMNNHEFVPDTFGGHSYTGFVCRKCGFGVMPPHSRYPVGTAAFRPRYNVGDYIYVRETWGINYGGYNYFAGLPQRMAEQYKWKPSIHMPKTAARIFLRVTDVRCERVQDIDEDGAAAEGVDIWSDACQDENWKPTYYDPDSGGVPSYVQGFQSLWDGTVNKSDINIYGWDANPWVWVYEFERVNAE